MGGAVLTRAAILAAQDIQVQAVPVPEWGGEVRVTMLTGTQRDAMSAAMVGPDGKADISLFAARLVAACIVDDTGAQVFTLDDVPALAAKSAAALDRVFRVAQQINRIGGDAVEAATGN